ncbi:MAG: amidohydrolase family protein [Gemmatimonadetes bacterium]|nr:amidohydrolase family protein [Gemmatimonadota bacterium]
MTTACETGSRADLVIIGGVVWTGASTGRPQPGAVAVTGDKILAVGDSAEIAGYVGSRTQIVAAAGGLVLPGFTDGHTHFLSGGFQLAAVDLREADSPREFVRRLAQFAKTLPPGRWITGGDWDHERWAGAPLPSRDWIDSVTPHNPVFVSRLDGHMALANSLALKAAGLTRDTQEPAGGVIVRDPRTAEPTGILKDNAMEPVWRVVPDPSPAERDSALVRALAHAAALGVTAIADMSTAWADVASFRRIRAAGRLTLRVKTHVALSDWRRLADTVARYGPGDDWIRIDGVKGYVDGSLGSTTAWFFDPYLDAPGFHGTATTPEESLRVWIGNADSAGLQVAVHAIGDRANALLFAMYDSVSRVHGERDRRFRIEHAQHLRQQEIPLFGRLGVIASMQPYHAIDDGRWAEKRIGPERIKGTYAFRALLDAEAPLAFGSDWTVAPIDPILGVYAAVTRRTLDGRHPNGWVPEQRITVAEVLRAYTAGNAWALFAEQKWGTLAPGYYADVVVVDRNLFTMPADSLDRVRVRYTIVGGKIVYRR